MRSQRMAEETKVRQHVLFSELQWIAWECDCCYREKVGQNCTSVDDSTKKGLYKKTPHTFQCSFLLHC